MRRSIIPLFCSLSACVGYTAADADLPAVAAEVAARPGGVLAVETAWDLALRQNPELRVLEAEARAAGVETTVPLNLTGEFRGRNEAVGLMVDPVALLGLGPRGAVIDSAEARRVAAVQALATARWRVMASVVECFLVDAALRELQLPDLAIDTEAFSRAGLASSVAVAALEAARAQAQREAVALRRMQRDNLAAARRLLGLDAATALELGPLPTDWLRQPAGEAAELLARPDLAWAAARFEVADAAFREAVAAQYPSLQIGPNVSLRGDPLRAMGMLQIPLGMDGLAAAARSRREAAREALFGAFLDAQQQAALAEERLAEAGLRTRAATASLRASEQAFAAARVGLEVEPDAFEAFARTAEKLIRDLRERRVAVVEVAGARVRRAEAWGWPRQAVQESGAVERRSEP